MIKGIIAFILGCIAFALTVSFAPLAFAAVGMGVNPWINLGLGLVALGLTVSKVVD